MSEQSTSAVRLTPVPWVVWRECTYVMHTGARVPHACVRGWSTSEALARELLEQLEDAQPDHYYVMGTADEWSDELRVVREELAAGRAMVELRVALAEWCCPACDVPALVMCARSGRERLREQRELDADRARALELELLEEPGNGGFGCARGTEEDHGR